MSTNIELNVFNKIHTLFQQTCYTCRLYRMVKFTTWHYTNSTHQITV